MTFTNFKMQNAHFIFSQRDLLSIMNAGASFLAKLVITSWITFSIDARTSELKQQTHYDSVLILNYAFTICNISPDQHGNHFLFHWLFLKTR